MNRKSPLPYYGGKAWLASWIVSLMPQHKAYIEPFAGMLNVLLAKPVVGPEIVNDNNYWLINWWKQVRDNPDELGRLTNLTPRSRVLFEEACNRIDKVNKPSGIKDALTFQIIVQQSILHSIDNQHSKWSRMFGREDCIKPYRISKLIKQCTNRLINVQIECRDAIDIIERVTRQDTLIYCDPPYVSANVAAYSKFKLNKDRFIEVITNSPAKIMLSGYPGDWNMLGWNYVSKRTSRMPHIKNPKLEALYMNFEPEQGSLL